MFNLFGGKEIKCPVDEPTRRWIEYAMKWMFSSFGEEFCKEQKVYVSLKELLNDFGKQQASLYDIANIVAEVMHLNMSEIVLDVYEEGEKIIESNSEPIYIKEEEGELTTGGLYIGKNEQGKYEVGIEKSLLKEPIALIYTIAHEFAHIKLLGEKRIEENDEYLTDLLPIIFGLGVFGANSVFSFSQTTNAWGYRTSGYLTQMEWGYALAVYTLLKEEENPKWLESLPKNIHSDYKKSLKFIENNRDKLFQQEL